MNKTARLEELLLQEKEITEEQLSQVLKIQKQNGKKIGEILTDKGYTTENSIMKILSEQLGFPIVDLDNYSIDTDVTKLISEKLAIRAICIPLKIKNNKLLIAMNEPLSIFDIEDIEMESGKKTEIVLAPKDQIINAIEKYIGGRSAEKAVEDFNRENLADEDFDDINEGTDSTVTNSPVVRLINSLIKQAMKMGASDIHIEPLESKIRIRVRIDGDLKEILTPSKYTQSAIITRVKIMAGMNIAD